MIRASTQNSKRPETLLEVAARTARSPELFNAFLREFMDEFYVRQTDRSDMIADEPQPIGEIQDAYLAAVAEHLSIKWGLTCPKWPHQKNRFLHKPYFASGLENLKATLLVESPTAFRRRMIFVGRDVLYRPRAETQNNLNFSP